MEMVETEKQIEALHFERIPFTVHLKCSVCGITENIEFDDGLFPCQREADDQVCNCGPQSIVDVLMESERGWCQVSGWYDERGEYHGCKTICGKCKKNFEQEGIE